MHCGWWLPAGDLPYLINAAPRRHVTFDAGYPLPLSLAFVGILSYVHGHHAGCGYDSMQPSPLACA